MYWLAFFFAFASCLIIIPFIRKWAIGRGCVSLPRDDRWHHRPTPIFGGVGIVLAFFVGIIFYISLSGKSINLPVSGVSLAVVGLLFSIVIIFIMGLLDDVYHLKPALKLGGQFVAALVVIASGIRTDFFTPRIDNDQLAIILNVLLSIGWIVGITNTINLIDNMDGVAAGVSLIASLALGFLFWQSGADFSLIISLALCGSLLGFLFYNFPPASIFMGDSGSQFLGFTLATMAIIRQPQASNVVAIIGVPALLFILPIIDTGLVAYTRILRGTSPLEGGRDHTTHRLIAFGLNERQVVIILYGVAIIAGFTAISIERIAYWLSLIFIPLILIGLALLAAYLGGLKIFVGPSSGTAKNSALVKLIYSLTYRRRLLELILDSMIVGISYYLAYIFFHGTDTGLQIPEYLVQSFPIILMISIFVLVVLGIYRIVWQFFSLDDVLRYFVAVVIIVLLSSIIIPFFYGVGNFNLALFILFGVFLFILLNATRASFRILNLTSNKLSEGKYQEQNNDLEQSSPLEPEHVSVPRQKILIIGTDSHGEYVLRWIQINPQSGLFPVGFITLDMTQINRRIRGVEIIGGIDDLVSILEKYHIDGVIIPPSYNHLLKKYNILEFCSKNNCWIREMVYDFRDITEY